LIPFKSLKEFIRFFTPAAAAAFKEKSNITEVARLATSTEFIISSRFSKA
jgi:hypothetical protein